MSFDAITLAATVDELREKVVGGRVQRVAQPNELTIGLELYAHRRREWLLLVADPQQPRIHLIGQRVGAAEKESPLLLLLRKHVRGRRLLAVDQPAFERTLTLRFGFVGPADRPASDDSDDDVAPELLAEDRDSDRGGAVALIIEAIGRYSNVVLVDEDGTVLDALKRVPADRNRFRVVLPHRPYVAPPPQTKRRPTAVTASEMASIVGTAPTDQPAWQMLVSAFVGVSPLLAREVVHRAHGRPTALAGEVDPKKLAAALVDLWSLPQTGHWEPGVVRDEAGDLVAFAPYRLSHLSGWQAVESIGRAVELFYEQGERVGPLDRARAVAFAQIDAQIDLLRRKQESLERALEQGAAMDRWRRYGEAILASLSQIRRGQTELIVGPDTIPLDPASSGSENAQRYFQRYRKAKAALAEVPRLLDETQLRRRYLEELRGLVGVAESVDAVRALRRDLTVRDGRQPQRSRRRSEPAGPLRLTTPDGFDVFIGRTSRQNDHVTFEIAGPEDIWLHARGVPGAHVILKTAGRQPSAETLRNVAALAAYHSAARASGTVVVDWTERKNVRRLGKRVPGLVSYRGERSVDVAPRSDLAVESPR